MGETGTYTTIKLGEDTVGGMLDITGRVPDEVPAHWLVYFAVEDTDATVAKAKERRRRASCSSRSTSPVGRFAVLNDPTGRSSP